MTSAAGMSDAQLGVAIEEAQAEVDARIGSRYSQALPLDPVPLVVKNATRDIAAYKATLTYLKGMPMANTDPVWLRYLDASRIVVGIGNGSITIPVGDGTTTPEDSTSGADEAGMVANPYAGSMFLPTDFGVVPTFGGGYYVAPGVAPQYPR